MYLTRVATFALETAGWSAGVAVVAVQVALEDAADLRHYRSNAERSNSGKVAANPSVGSGHRQ